MIERKNQNRILFEREAESKKRSSGKNLQKEEQRIIAKKEWESQKKFRDSLEEQIDKKKNIHQLSKKLSPNKLPIMKVKAKFLNLQKEKKF